VTEGDRFRAVPRPWRSLVERSAFACIGLVLAVAPAAAAEPVRGEPLARSEPLPRAAIPRLLVPTLHALSLMTAMRLSEAYLWPEPFAETNPFKLGLHYHAAFSRPPVWDNSRPLFREDGDRWQINVLGHGLFGSELYLRARTCHLAPWQALLFSGAASATWEYGFEANGVRPSALDLTFTPLAGIVLGETRYQTWRALRRLDGGALRTTLSAVIDPLGDLERALGTPC
jgi:uncharacterized protein DUF3943